MEKFNIGVLFRKPSIILLRVFCTNTEIGYINNNYERGRCLLR